MALQALRSISMAVRRARPVPKANSSSSWQSNTDQRTLDLRVANMLIASGTVMMAVGGYSMYMDHQVTQIRDEMWNDLATLERTRRQNAEERQKRLREQPEKREQELYRARITRDVSLVFNGPVALKNVRVGEVVAVIEEDVGPKGDYIRVRSTETGKDGEAKEGWYPKKCLELEGVMGAVGQLGAAKALC